MKNKTTIHIGLHKTGTTFLQHKIFPKFDECIYLTRPYTQHNHIFNQLQYADDSLFDIENAINFYSQFDNKTLLISDESLTGKPLYFSYINRSIIAQRIKAIFDNPNIVLFIRGQAKILESEYNTYINGWHGQKTAEELFWYPIKDFTFEEYLENNNQYNIETLYYNTNGEFIHYDSFKYLELINLYKSLFENVYIFLFENFITEPQNVVKQIEDIVEEKILGLETIDFNNKVNASVNQLSLEQVRFKNKLDLFPINNTLKSFLLTFFKVRANKNSSNKEFYHRMAKKYYRNNNAEVVKKYPEIGLQNYPKQYFL